MNIVQQYLKGLKKAYCENGGEKLWNDFEKVVHGASKEDIERLHALYPDIPDSLLELLKIVDGTYWREYYTTLMKLQLLQIVLMNICRC